MQNLGGLLTQWLRRTAAIVVGLVAVIVLWEGYKALGLNWPVKSNDLTMPPLRDIWDAFWDPVQRGSSESLAVFLLKASLTTLKEAALGFALGTFVGLLLAAIMLRSSLLERGMLPWVNISQTVPLIALAPIVVTWGRTNGWSDTWSVATIAAYLTFFPVAVNGLKGLQSPNAASRCACRQHDRSCFPHSSLRRRSVSSARSLARYPQVSKAGWVG